MKQQLIDALQEQFNRERMNHAAYRALADQLDNMYWPGSSAWMRKSSDEEQAHADKFAAYMVDRNITPRYAPLEAPAALGETDLTRFFEAALELEQGNTESIKELYYVAQESEDPQTCTFLIWALDEQTAAERELTDYITMLRRLSNDGMLVFDNELK